MQISTKRKVRRNGKIYEQDTSGINAGREADDSAAEHDVEDDAEDEPAAASAEYDSAAGYLRQKLVDTIERIDAWPSVEDAMVAWMAGRQRGRDQSKQNKNNRINRRCRADKLTALKFFVVNLLVVGK